MHKGMPTERSLRPRRGRWLSQCKETRNRDRDTVIARRIAARPREPSLAVARDHHSFCINTFLSNSAIWSFGRILSMAL